MLPSQINIYPWQLDYVASAFVAVSELNYTYL
jgi:hypothetical protein